jgi:hypothetical protein
VRWLYKPFGLVLGMLAAVVANALVRKTWSAARGGKGVPTAREPDASWKEVAASAALQGAVMGGTKALVDRAGAAGFEKATGTWPA